MAALWCRREMTVRAQVTVCSLPDEYVLAIPVSDDGLSFLSEFPMEVVVPMHLFPAGGVPSQGDLITVRVVQRAELVALNVLPEPAPAQQAAGGALGSDSSATDEPVTPPKSSNGRIDAVFPPQPAADAVAQRPQRTPSPSAGAPPAAVDRAPEPKIIDPHPPNSGNAAGPRVAVSEPAPRAEPTPTQAPGRVHSAPPASSGAAAAAAAASAPEPSFASFAPQGEDELIQALQEAAEKLQDFADRLKKCATSATDSVPLLKHQAESACREIDELLRSSRPNSSAGKRELKNAVKKLRRLEADLAQREIRVWRVRAAATSDWRNLDVATAHELELLLKSGTPVPSVAFESLADFPAYASATLQRRAVDRGQAQGFLTRRDGGPQVEIGSEVVFAGQLGFPPTFPATAPVFPADQAPEPPCEPRAGAEDFPHFHDLDSRSAGASDSNRLSESASAAAAAGVAARPSAAREDSEHDIQRSSTVAASSFSEAYFAAAAQWCYRLSTRDQALDRGLATRLQDASDAGKLRCTFAARSLPDEVKAFVASELRVDPETCKFFVHLGSERRVLRCKPSGSKKYLEVCDVLFVPPSY